MRYNKRCVYYFFLLNKDPKASCQTEWRGVGAREMAARKRAEAAEATENATRRYQDPLENMSTDELRSSLENQTGQSKK